MPQQIVIELTDDQVTSIDKYLSTKLKQTEDEVTGSSIVIRQPGFEDIETFVHTQMTDLLNNICTAYPSGAQRDIMRQRKALEDQLRGTAKPSSVHKVDLSAGGPLAPIA